MQILLKSMKKISLATFNDQCAVSPSKPECIGKKNVERLVDGFVGNF
jgi:hypothetical protein